MTRSLHLLACMRTPGGKTLPADVKKAMAQQVYRPTNIRDRRLSLDYTQTDAEGRQVGPTGVFAENFHSAIN